MRDKVTYRSTDIVIAIKHRGNTSNHFSFHCSNIGKDIGVKWIRFAEQIESLSLNALLGRNDSVKKRAYRVVHFVGIGFRHFVHASRHFARRIVDLFEAAVFFQFLDQLILDSHKRFRETDFLTLKFTFERPFSGNALANWWPWTLLAMSEQTDFNVSSRALAICRCTKAKRRARRNIACFTRVGISRGNRETTWLEQLRCDGYLHRDRTENDTDWSHTP